MIDKVVWYNNLYLIYKDLLTENNKDIFDLYYGENLTMQEIADLKKVSKSRIGAIIKRVQKKLDFFEDKLHINKKSSKLLELLEMDEINQIKQEIVLILKGE